MQKEGLYRLSSITSDLSQQFFEENIQPRNELRRDSVLVFAPELDRYLPKSELDSLLQNAQLEHYIDSAKAFREKREKQFDELQEMYDLMDEKYDFYGGYWGISNYGLDSGYYDSMIVSTVNPRFKEQFQTEYEGAQTSLYPMANFGDTLGLGGLIVARLYTGATENHYAFLVGNHKTIIIKRLIPQIAFSLVVFISTGLAFMLMIMSVRRLREFSAMKNDFVSNMTHELKTPIATVAVALEALTNFNAMKDTARSEEYIDISKKELNRLSILVDKVLKMTMFDEKEPELVMEPLNLKQLSADITESMKLLFEKAKGNYALTFDGDNFNIQGDKVHITNVIYNLIENALKYSPTKPMVKISVVEKKDSVVLNVSDNGVGIEADQQSKIFDKFYRVPQPGDRHNVKGHGLGLAYVSKVLEKHRGSIALRSEKGQGSTFLITLPKAA